MIIPKQGKAAPIIKRSILDDDDELQEEEDEDELQVRRLPFIISSCFTTYLLTLRCFFMILFTQLPERRGQSLIPMTSKTNSLQRGEINRALEEDPNIFAYDEVYDELKGKKESSSSSTTGQKKEPKYMTNLLKSAELRKREHERREEKKIQKEREEEGDQFNDKEAFITSAYKEKLKELKETEEREKKEAVCENILDVKKQSDLSGFYRHFLNQSVGSESIPTQSSSERFESKKSELSESFKQVRGTKRNLRNRRDSGSSSSSEEDDQTTKDKQKEIVTSPKKIPESPTKPTEHQVDNISIAKNEIQSESCEKSAQQNEFFIPEEIEPKPDRNELIRRRFEKRTVGNVFEDALERYRQRKGMTMGPDTRA